MTSLMRQDLEKILEMYSPEAILLSEVHIDFPFLEGILWFPEKPVYLREGSGIYHFNDTEAVMVSNQAAFLLYRAAILSGDGGFPRIEERDLRRLYDYMFVKKRNTRFEKFLRVRKGQTIYIRVTHQRLRKVRNTYFLFYNVSIPGFMNSEVVGGIYLNPAKEEP
ncbi:hypothetical protein J7K74_01135 [Candidatus Woesearchaeota archaeon]|nr:hypothetical protein [Candidatus Woesearchaeota archaeon]